MNGFCFGLENYSCWQSVVVLILYLLTAVGENPEINTILDSHNQNSVFSTSSSSFSAPQLSEFFASSASGPQALSHLTSLRKVK